MAAGDISGLREATGRVFAWASPLPDDGKHIED